MDNKTHEHVDIITLRLLYDRYKVFFVPFLVIVVVVGVFIKVNVPAIQDLLMSYEEQKSTKLALENMQIKLNLLKGIDASSLDSQFKIVSKALPIDKDFDSILNAISDSSNKSGVALGGFKFEVGSLSKVEEEKEYQTLKISVKLTGNAEAVDKFIEKLAKSLPLSEIIKISAKTETSDVEIGFYYKPLIELKINDNLPLGQVSNEGLNLISEMSSFVSQTPSLDLDSIPVSTPSANPFF